jgi:hypothetical protein
VPVIFPLEVPVGTNQPSPERERSAVCVVPLLKMTFDEVAAGILNTYHPLPSYVIAVPGHVFDAGEPFELQ